MRKTLGVLAGTVVAALAAVVFRAREAAAQGDCPPPKVYWYEAYGYNEKLGKYTCLGTACPGGWCCKICSDPF